MANSIAGTVTGLILGSGGWPIGSMTANAWDANDRYKNHGWCDISMVKFYVTIFVAIIGALLIVLSTSLFEQILPKPYSLLLLIIGFVLVIVPLLLMKSYKR